MRIITYFVSFYALLAASLPLLGSFSDSYTTVKRLPLKRYDQPGLRVTSRPSDISLIGEHFTDEGKKKSTTAPESKEEEFLFSGRFQRRDEEQVAFESTEVLKERAPSARQGAPGLAR